MGLSLIRTPEDSRAGILAGVARRGRIAGFARGWYPSCASTRLCGPRQSAGDNPQENRTMAEEQSEKTPPQKLKNVVSQLKEMEHYARNNMESLSEIWLLLDDEFKKQKTLADRANDLLTAQSTMQEQLTSVIEDFDKACAEMEKKA
jgi:hypothetical protein